MQADTRQVYEGEMTAKQRQELRDAEVATWKEANCWDGSNARMLNHGRLFNTIYSDEVRDVLLILAAIITGQHSLIQWL